MKKKKLKKALNDVRKANHSCLQFFTYLQQNYDFENDENKQFDNVRDHLINMNVLFSNIEKNMENTK